MPVACHCGSRGSSAIVPSCIYRYFVGPKCFLLSISWARSFFSSVWISFVWVFRGDKFFLVADFVIRKFSVAGCIRKNNRKQIEIYISNRVFFFKSISKIVHSVYIRKVFRLINYLRYYQALICTNCIFSHLFSSELGSFHL